MCSSDLGTPTDCVFLAVQELLPRRPDWVLSGVNHGMNMGEDVLYSGTVSAAMEACVLGIPSVAISYAGRAGIEHLEAYGPLLARLLAQLLARGGLPHETLLNVNLPPIPPEEVKGVRVTRLGRRVFSDGLTRGTDPSGRPYFWIGDSGDVLRGNLHVAFAAKTRAQVDAFYKAALAAGARDNGAPALHPEYHPNYYGAFVLDPDGHNIEAVCHAPG